MRARRINADDSEDLESDDLVEAPLGDQVTAPGQRRGLLSLCGDSASREMDRDTDSSQEFLLPKKHIDIRRRRKFCRNVLICFVLQLCLAAVLLAIGIALGYAVLHPTATSAGFPGYQPTPFKDEICAKNPVMQVSLDGYWSGYLARNRSYFLRSLASTGVRAEYLRSQYPTKTFPNHFSIVTGLFPEFHGIVDNAFYDKHLKEKFTIRNADELDPKWWLGEPVWITAEKQGVIAGIYFWPGSGVEIEGTRPHYYYKYSGSDPFINRVRTVLSWFDLPNDQRYGIDTDSHRHDKTTAQGGEAIGVRGVSITGCFPTSVNEVLLSVAANKTKVYEMFKYPNGSTFHPAVEVYYREEAPPRYHIGHSTQWRYGDIVMATKVGWLLTTRNLSIAGQHGYNNNAEQMRAIFVAHGPAFRRGIVVPAFDNIEIYNLVCALLNIKPSDNNGTFGSLYPMLRPEVASKLPPAQTHNPLPEHHTNCSFPKDESVFLQRANLTCQLQDSNCTISYDSRITAAKSLNISQEEVQMFQHYHLPWGVPAGGGGSGRDGACLLTGRYFVVKYNAELHIPIWAAYRLEGQSSANIDPMPSEGVECFSHDPRVDLSLSSNCSDYTDTAFAKGQMVPASHMQSNATAEELTYLLSNAAPQYEVYNRGVGSYLDDKVQEWANNYSTVYVISGVVLDANNDGQRDPDDTYSRWTKGRGTTAVPSHFFKVISYCSDPDTTNVSACPVEQLHSVAFLTINSREPVPEEKQDMYIQERMTTLREVETITGISFFPHLSITEQNTLALRIVTSLEDV